MTNLRVSLTRSDDDLRQAFAALETARDVADLLEIPYAQLHYITSRRADRYPYRVFEVPKRSGGQRLISAPHDSLKIPQGKLNRVFRLVYEPRRSTHGFVENRSIVTNAERHTRRQHVLNVDLLDFFPSINFGRVRGLFMNPPYGVGDRAATVLARICCEVNDDIDRLPQGAPTSPVISNMICRPMDRQLSGLARETHSTYSRYADDLTFSTTRRDLPDRLAVVEEGGQLHLGARLVDIIENNGFRVNPAKIRLQSGRQHQEVTGLTVNRFPNVARRFVRQIRAMLHDWEKNGYQAAEQRYRNEFDRSRGPLREPVSFRDVVYGKLSFLKAVRGADSPVYRRLRARLLRLDGKVEEKLIDNMLDTAPERRYDVALSFAKPERPLALELATLVAEAGFVVFYDHFYKEELWGEDLPVTFQSIYRDQARYCAIFMSQAYVDRMWTDVERQHAVERAITEKGAGYILPIKVEDAQIPGISTMIGRMSIDEDGIDGIAAALIKKLGSG